jgi:hypothetical protein
MISGTGKEATWTVHHEEIEVGINPEEDDLRMIGIGGRTEGGTVDGVRGTDRGIDHRYLGRKNDSGLGEVSSQHGQRCWIYFLCWTRGDACTLYHIWCIVRCGGYSDQTPRYLNFARLDDELLELLERLRQMAEERVVRVAVIGSGLAGLTAASLLSSADISLRGNARLECHLFEKVNSLDLCWNGSSSSRRTCRRDR